MLAMIISKSAPAIPWNVLDIPSGIWHGLQAPTLTSVREQELASFFVLWLRLLAFSELVWSLMSVNVCILWLCDVCVMC